MTGLRVGLARPGSTRRIAAGITVVAVVALGGCDADPDDSGTVGSTAPQPSMVTETAVAGDATEPSTTTSTSTSVAAAAPVLIDVVNQPGTGEFDGAVGDIADQSCTVAAGRWTSAGSVRNSTEAAADYRVYVSFLDPEGETLALVERDLDAVGADESQQWSVVFDTSVTDVRCVLRIERRPAD